MCNMWGGRVISCAGEPSQAGRLAEAGHWEGLAATPSTPGGNTPSGDCLHYSQKLNVDSSDDSN